MEVAAAGVHPAAIAAGGSDGPANVTDTGAGSSQAENLSVLDGLEAKANMVTAAMRINNTTTTLPINAAARSNSGGGGGGSARNGGAGGGSGSSSPPSPPITTTTTKVRR